MEEKKETKQKQNKQTKLRKEKKKYWEAMVQAKVKYSPRWKARYSTAGWAQFIT